MASTTETGHAKNVANFEKLIASFLTFGTKYNPSNVNIKLSALQTLAGEAKDSLAAVNTGLSVLKKAEAGRKVAFSPLNKLITRVVNGVKAAGVAKVVEQQVMEIARKIQGTRASPKRTEEDKNTLAANGQMVKEISTSQMSYDSRIENLDKLVKLLQGIPEYLPNEAELKIDALVALNSSFLVKNNAVVTANAALSKARAERNAILYTEGTGLVDLAMDAKAYIKSAFGASSPEHKQVSKIQFERI